MCAFLWVVINFLYMHERPRNFSMRLGPFQEVLRYNPQEFYYNKYKTIQFSPSEGFCKPIVITSPSTDSESKHLKFQHHRKFIHKQKNINKQYVKPEPHKHEERNSHYSHCVVLKRQILTQKDLKSRQKSMECIFDWMMEASSLIKLTKNAFYRAILIIKRFFQIDTRYLTIKKAVNYACGALSIGGKFQGTTCVQLIVSHVGRRISKEDIIEAEANILKMFDWHIPINVLIEQELHEGIRMWNDYLNVVNRDSKDKAMYNKLLINPWQKGSSKLYIQIVYIIDFLVTKKHYELLKGESFQLPILMSIYINLSFQVGDHLLQHCIWPLFQKFLVLYQLLPAEDLSKFRSDLDRYSVELNIIEALGIIPLNKSFQKFIKKWNEQFYIPKITHIQ